MCCLRATRGRRTVALAHATRSRQLWLLTCVCIVTTVVAVMRASELLRQLCCDLESQCLVVLLLVTIVFLTVYEQCTDACSYR
jgi:uncharacterized membrane protein